MSVSEALKAMQKLSQPKTPHDCLIYCRVSSKRQVTEGNGLGSQEKLCRNRADAKDYHVEKVFGDDGISGALFDRPAMRELIAYLDAHPHKQYVVIFDDLKRFARDYTVHLKIKSELLARGVILECLNFNFEDSPESEFIEGVLALQGELERKQNKRQVIQKQKARLERGYWPFCPPLGLKNTKTKRDGKILEARQPFANILKEALEGFASNHFITQEQVKQFIESEYRKIGIERRISIHGVQEILKNPLYAGLIEYLPWEVPRAKAQHEGFISPETFQAVQNKIAERTKVRSRKDFDIDFPLRQWALCDGCGHPLTASWVGGRSKHYPTYSCFQAGCPFRYKSIRRGRIEPEFEALLGNAKLSLDFQDLAKAIFMDVWQTQKAETANEEREKSRVIHGIDEQISNLVGRISAAKTQTLVGIYESQIEQLVVKKEAIGSKPQQLQFTEKQFGTALDCVFQTLENPLSLWKSDCIEDKRTIQLMYFEKPPRYSLEKGFGTVEFSEAINVFRSIGSDKIQSVEMRGNEPLSATAT